MPLQAQHPNNKQLAADLIEFLPTATYPQAVAAYGWMIDDPNSDPWVEAQVAEQDRFFLLTWILRRRDAYHPWLYDRCREVEADPDEHLDLWARGHYKSSIITFAGSFQEVIKSRGEITIGVFSHTKGIARAFVNQHKDEMEQNAYLPQLWPDIFWADPVRQAPRWALDRGLVVQRSSNPVEATIEGHGLVDGQPTSKHFGLRIYNDVVTEESVNTAEMIAKTTQRWELSQNLAVTERAGGEVPRQWHEGTRYHFGDTYGTILDRDALTPRIYPATDTGTPDGQPVFLTVEAWEKKKKKESASTIACQQLLNPLAGGQQEFKPEWVRPWYVRPEVLNVAVLVDGASSRKKESSDTAMAVVGIDGAHNKYLLDGACHKMSLTERWTMLKGLRKKWVNSKGIQVVRVGYERYSSEADIEHYREMMQIEKYSFEIEEVSWTRDHTNAKEDRIRRLIPDHQNWRFFYPDSWYGTKTDPETKQPIGEPRFFFTVDKPTKLQRQAVASKKAHLIAKPIMRKDENGKLYNLAEKVINNEYMFFGAIKKLDFMDAMSRFYDLDMRPPQVIYNERDVYPTHYEDF